MKRILLFSFLLSGLSALEASSNKLKILFVVDVFPQDIKKSFLNHIIWFDKQGYSINILANSNKKQGCNAFVFDDIEKYNLLTKTLYEYLPQDIQSFDIIFCAGFNVAEKFASLKKSKIINSKLVVVVNEDGIQEIRDNKSYLKKVCDHVDLMLPTCDYMVDVLHQFDSSKKVVVCRDTVDCNQIAKSMLDKLPDQITVVTAGPLIKKNGLMYSLAAMIRLLRKKHKITYVIIGDGWFEKKMQKAIEKAFLTKQIRIIHPTSSEEISCLLDKAHIFLLPVLDADGIPTELLEAMARGVPVIATASGGIAEIIQDKKTGFLVLKKDIQDIVVKTEEIIRNYESLRSAIGAESRKFIKKYYDFTNVSKQLEMTLKEL